MEEQKTVLIEKLAIFEQGVLQELKAATEHFSFSSYEDSFKKVEEDMDSFYKELVRIRDEQEGNTKEYLEWKGQLGKDLLMFYQKQEKFTVDGVGFKGKEVEILSDHVKSIQDLANKSKQLLLNTKRQVQHPAVGK